MSETPDLAQQVANVLSKILDQPVDPSRREASLIQDYDADSMDIVDMVERLERHFQVRIPDAAIDQLQTFGNVLDFIEGKRLSQGS